MKKILLSISACLLLAPVFSQSTSDRTSAITAFKAFQRVVTEGNLDQAKKELLEAKKYIDLAYGGALLEDPKTLFYRGQIYQSLPMVYADMEKSTGKDICSAEIKFKGLDDATIREYRKTAIESYKLTLQKIAAGAKDKDGYKETIEFTMNNTRVTSMNCGNTNYNEKNYERAISNYTACIGAMDVLGKVDTMAHYNRGLCYERTGKNEEAAADFIVCAKYNYGGADVYRLIFETSAAAGKVEEGAKYLKEGRTKYPKEQSLVFSEVNYFLSQGMNVEAEKAINEAISFDPKNPTLYFALGNTYDNLANPRDKNGKDMPKPKNFTELVSKAAGAYQKAIDIKPDYFDALYNLGVLKYNEGAEHMNVIKDIPDNTEYENEKKKADEMFAAALPFLAKAREVNPKDKDNLRMLKMIYYRLGQNDKADEVQKELEK